MNLNIILIKLRQIEYIILIEIIRSWKHLQHTSDRWGNLVVKKVDHTCANSTSLFSLFFARQHVSGMIPFFFFCFAKWNIFNNKSYNQNARYPCNFLFSIWRESFPMKSVITWQIERNIQFTHLQRKRYDTSCLLGLHYYSHYVSFQINAPTAQEHWVNKRVE